MESCIGSMIENGSLRGFAKIARDATDDSEMPKKRCVSPTTRWKNESIERTRDLLATNR